MQASQQGSGVRAGWTSRRRVAWTVAVLMALPGLGAVRTASAESSSRVETTTRFVQYDEVQGLLAYEFTLRNVGSLPVSAVRLSTDPPCLEGPLEVGDLGREQQVGRRFTFKIDAQRRVFQPRFELQYTDYEGQRITVAPDRSPLILEVDFAAVDLATGRVSLRVDLNNLGTDNLLFLDLWSENPTLTEGDLALGDLEPGQSLSREVHFQLDPGERYFNPTLHLSFHALKAEGSRLHRRFYTIVQPQLDKVAAALAAGTR